MMRAVLAMTKLLIGGSRMRTTTRMMMVLVSRIRERCGGVFTGVVLTTETVTTWPRVIMVMVVMMRMRGMDHSRVGTGGGKNDIPNRYKSKCLDPTGLYLGSNS